MYDLTNRKSFDNTINWLNEIKQYTNGMAPTILISNKLDLSLSRQVSFEEGRALANEKGLYFMEVSARDCGAIEIIFEVLARVICEVRVG